MPNFAANLSTMFTDVPFLERFQRAAEAGFNGVEFQYAYDQEAGALRQRLQDAGLVQTLINAPPGDGPGEDMGLAALPGRENAFRASIERAAEYADALQCACVHVLAGNMSASIDAQAAMETYMHNLHWACEQLADSDVTLVIEPINSRDRPRYFLNTPTDARAVLDTLDQDNIGMLLDLYHCQIMEGDLCANIEQNLSVIEHMQFAGSPGRHEPDIGEINFPFVFEQIDALAYSGWVGCEYHPIAETERGLSWFAGYRKAG